MCAYTRQIYKKKTFKIHQGTELNFCLLNMPRLIDVLLICCAIHTTKDMNEDGTSLMSDQKHGLLHYTTCVAPIPRFPEHSFKVATRDS